MRGDEKQRKYAFTRVLEITALLLLMLVSIASAEQTIIDSITIDPDPPVYEELGAGYYAQFTVTVHVTNPPAGGYLSYYCGCDSDTVLIDNNGMATFKGGLSIAYNNDYGVYHECPPGVNLYMWDDQGNVVARAEKPIYTAFVPSITWNSPDYMSSVTPLSSTQLNAVASLLWGGSIPGTFVYTPAAGTVLSEGTHTLHVDFIPDGTAKYKTASKDVTIEVHNPVTPEITWSNPADITCGTALSSTQLNAVSWLSGAFVYTPSEGTILSEGTNTLHVEFIPSNTEMYTTVSKDVTINVLTHVQEVHQITTAVQSLNLIPEQANLLIIKLDTATQNLNKGNTLAATNNLNSFVNQVNAYINDGKISSTEGQALIDDANDLITAINSLNLSKKSVPEFPSIALPIISIVGLLLLFGRKKIS